MMHEARELGLFVENDRELYDTMIEPYIRNTLCRRVKAGTYDADKALKGWRNIADAGARAYIREFCTAGERWHEMFTVAARDEAAAYLADAYADYLDEVIQ